MNTLTLAFLAVITADPSIPSNYCGRVDQSPQIGVKHYLTSPGYPGKTTEAGRCQWLIKSNGAEKLVFSDLQVQSFCGKAGSIITFVDINGRERTANNVLCKNKPGPVHVSLTDSTEVILAFPVGAVFSVAYSKAEKNSANRIKHQIKSGHTVDANSGYGYRPPVSGSTQQLPKSTRFPMRSQGANYQSYDGYSYNQHPRQANRPIVNYDQEVINVYEAPPPPPAAKSQSSSNAVQVFSIIGMVCFMVAIVGFIAIMKHKRRGQTEEEDSK